MKLFVRLFLVIILAVVLTVASSGFFSFNSTKEIITKNIISAQENTAYQTLDRIDRFLYERQLDLSSVADSTILTRFVVGQSTAREASDRFDRYWQNTGPWDNLTLIDSQGLMVLSNDQNLVGKTINEKDFPFNFSAFQKALAGENYYSDAVISKITNQPTVVFSAPLYNQDDPNRPVIGVVIGQLSWPIISEILSEINSSVHLYKQDGTIIAVNNRDHYGDIFAENNFETDFFKKVIVEKKGSVVSTSIHGDFEALLSFNTESGYLSFKGNEWILVVEQKSSEAFAPAVSTALFQVLTLIPVNTAAGVVVLLIFYFFIFKPLKDFLKITKSFTKGDFSGRIEVKRLDELGELAEAFNLMADRLADYQSSLEKKIKERTAELDQRNTDLQQSKIATLNILEDVEVEKEKSQALAADLEKFKLAVDNASDHIVITNADGRILYANKGVERITGFSIKEVLGQKAGGKENWGGLMSADFYQKLWQTIKEKRQVFVGQLENHRKNGNKYEVLASISPIINAAGQVVFFVGIERDITKEKEIDKAKTEFVSLASHQLRTPLSAINWYAEMLLAGDAGKMNEDQKKFVDEIYKGNKRMVDLVNALLNVSRLELGTFTIEPKPCQITEIADSVLGEIKPQIKTRKQKLIKEYETDFPIMQLDEKLIRIVLQNLLTNAVKYTPEAGSVKLEIRKKVRTAEITVSDTGLGIPKAQQNKIFSKLFRADNVRSSDTEGTGLGLYIVKAIVDQSGGTIKFESEENKGTKFVVNLPIKGMIKKEGTKSLA